MPQTPRYECQCGNIAYYRKRTGWQCKCNTPKRKNPTPSTDNKGKDLHDETRTDKVTPINTTR